MCAASGHTGPGVKQWGVVERPGERPDKSCPPSEAGATEEAIRRGAWTPKRNANRQRRREEGGHELARARRAQILPEIPVEREITSSPNRGELQSTGRSVSPTLKIPLRAANKRFGIGRFPFFSFPARKWIPGSGRGAMCSNLFILCLFPLEMQLFNRDVE